jgi:hypothetical protein
MDIRNSTYIFARAGPGEGAVDGQSEAEGLPVGVVAGIEDEDGNSEEVGIEDEDGNSEEVGMGDGNSEEVGIEDGNAEAFS